jgi:predicted nucleotidyltransferase
VSISRSDIDKVVDQIVEQFSPQQVVLFGSNAYGQPTTDSDVDVLVVMETDETPLHAAARISESVDHPFPLDLIVRKPADFAAQLAERSSFESRIQRDGFSLYEAADPGQSLYEAADPGQLQAIYCG